MQSVKVVITGAFDAGKTTFIKSVSEITVLSTERQVTGVESLESGETTVAMDFGRITISDDVVLYLFGTPGQERFSFMWETLAEGMLGFVVMVDGTSDDSIHEAVSMIEFFTRISDVPFVVAANRVSEGDAAGLERIRSTLALPPKVALIGCDARDRESVKSVLLGLLFRILQTLE